MNKPTIRQPLLAPPSYRRARRHRLARPRSCDVRKAVEELQREWKRRLPERLSKGLGYPLVGAN
jgi:hypothetical protein